MRIKPFSILLIIMLSSVIGLSIVSAQCTPAQSGTNSGETIECTGVVGPDVSGNGGDDVIINNGTVTGAIEGNDGNDTITNSATGTTTWIDGNNGNDTIINDGTVVMGMMGYDGDDTLINNSNVGGMMMGMGGNDTIILNTATATSDGDYLVLLDGGTETDTLQFDYYTQTDYDAAAPILAAANPAGGTIIINGVTYDWINFEQLLAILHLAIPTGSTGSSVITMSTAEDGTISITTTTPAEVSDGRLNWNHRGYEPVALYCKAGGYQVYSASGQPLINVLANTVSGSLETAIAQQQNQMLGQNGQVTLWALFTNEIQVQDDATGYKYIVNAAGCS